MQYVVSVAGLDFVCDPEAVMDCHTYRLSSRFHDSGIPQAFV